ncbi:MAG: hypothetical protein HQL31_05730 [Planctomycetes bacterium]|nr:hypothetical protein [Planctomycetota bacterium]
MTNDNRSMKLELKADVTRLWQLELKSTYSSGNYGALAVRECFQNSLDAYRRGKLSDGVFKVHVEDSSISITDWAGGMNPETLQNKFLTLGVTDKTGDPDSIGGFGVAKAVILGAGNPWNLRTQDFEIDSVSMNTRASEYFSGFEVKLTRDCIRQERGDMLMYLGLSKPKWPVCLKGNLLEGFVDLGRARILEFSGLSFGRAKHKISCYRKQAIEFPTPSGSRYQSLENSGYLVARLNGLVQFWEHLYDLPEHLVIVDLEPASSPGEDDYPFTKGRDGFKGNAQSSWYTIRHYLEQECVSAAREDRWSEIDFKATRTEADDDYDSDGFTDEHAIKKPDQVQLQTTGNQIAASSLTDLLASKHPDVHRLSEREDMEFTGKENPVSFDWKLLKAKGMKGNFKLKLMAPILSLWKAMLDKMLPLTGMGEKSISPGIVLNNDINGLCEARDGKYTVFINPMNVKAMKQSARETGLYMWQLMCHELAHVTSSNHNEAFSTTRERISRDTAPLAQDFMILGEEYLEGTDPKEIQLLASLCLMGFSRKKAKLFLEKTPLKVVNRRIKAMQELLMAG